MLGSKVEDERGKDLWGSSWIWSREFVAGGVGGVSGVIYGYPLDTIRILQQNSNMATSFFSLIKNVVSKEGPASLYRGMAAITFQTTIVSPVELVKIRLQLQSKGQLTEFYEGPLSMTRKIWNREGLRGIFRGFGITVLRDAPSHGVYFWTYMREKLHPGCRKTSQENLSTMVIVGGLDGVVSWIGPYPFDVIKTRLQVQTQSSLRYKGILDCLAKSVTKEGHNVLWRGIGTGVGRAFIVNGAVFAAYEIAMRSLSSDESSSTNNLGDPSFSRNKRQ